MQTEYIIRKYLTAFCIVLLGFLLVYGVKEFFSAFLGAVVFYILFRKFMAYLTFRKNFHKALAALIIILISFVIVVLPLAVLGGMIFQRVSRIAENPDKIKNYVNSLSEKLEHLPFGVNIKLGDVGDRVVRFLSQHAGDVVSSTFNVLASLLMMYFLLYFFLVNVRKLENRLYRYLPFKNEKIKPFSKELIDQTYGNAIGVPAVAAAQGIASYIAYLIAGVPDAGILAILTAFASVIPLVGTGIIWVPVCIFVFASGNTWQGFFIAGYCVILMTNLDNLVRMIVSRRVGDVHPVITVLGVIFGLRYFGLPGLVFGPLLFSYFILLVKIFHAEYTDPSKEVPEDLPEPESGAITKLARDLLLFTERFRGEGPKGKK